MGVGTLRLKDDEALTVFLRARHVKVHAEAKLVQPMGATGRWAKHEKAAKKPKPVKPPKPRSEIEQMLSDQIKAAGLPAPIEWPAQHAPIEYRKYRVDFSWPDKKLIVDVDGAVHRIKGTFKASFERGYLLLKGGWKVLHVGGDQVRDGTAVEWVKDLFHA